MITSMSNLLHMSFVMGCLLSEEGEKPGDGVHLSCYLTLLHVYCKSRIMILYEEVEKRESSLKSEKILVLVKSCHESADEHGHAVVSIMQGQRALRLNVSERR